MSSQWLWHPTLQQGLNGGFGNPMRVFARLKPGVSVAQAYAQMLPLVDSERSQFPASVFNEVRLSMRSLRDRDRGRTSGCLDFLRFFLRFF